MLATVLKSDVCHRCEYCNYTKAFKKLREFSKHYNALAKKIMEVERKSDRQYKELTKALEDLINESKKVDE